MLSGVFAILAWVVGGFCIVYAAVHIYLNCRSDKINLKRDYSVYGKSKGIGYYIRSVDSVQQTKRINERK